MNIFPKILGDRFNHLPPQVQAFHDPDGTTIWTGTTQVRRGSNPLARLICHLFSFPEAGDAVPLRLTVTPLAQGEHWDRDFGGRHMSTTLIARDGWLIEYLGPIRIYMRPVLEGDRFRVLPERWSFFAVPLPTFLIPKSDNYEAEENGCFLFDVSINAPLVGLLVSYRGRLDRLQPGRHTT
ncbi:MAG: DUF4166 domain-containing protein [Pseudomonadota bacterium]